MPHSRPLLAVLASTAAAVAGLVVVAPAHANTAGTGLVISEAYNNGGSAGATYTNKYVEIANPTGSDISLTGLSLQYRSAGGTTNATSALALSGSVPAHGFFVVQGTSNGSNGVALPHVDQTGGPNTSGASGTIFLANGTSPINPGMGSALSSDVVDLLGYGSSNTFEGTPAATGSVTTSPSRDGAEKDTDVNNTDFTARALTPGATNVDTTPPPPPTEHTIAEIQGSGSASPYVGQSVITEGVVTAAYPSGGFSGYTIQTDGTGGSTDATPGESDAVFVYQPSGAVTAEVGDLVKVTGSVSEFSGLTELTVPAAQMEDLGTPVGVAPLSIAYPTTDAAREAHESELLAPTDRFTATDNYSTNQYGEIGLATGDHQLWQPTDLYNPRLDPGKVAQVAADNAARGVVLDDGSSWNYLTSHKNDPMAWLTQDNPVRIGSSAVLNQPVILDYRNSLWKFQPTHQVTGDGSEVATFSDTRSQNEAPQDVGGDLRLGTFNVLNYFNTTGEDWVGQGGGHACTYYTDRVGDPVGDNECTPDGPRGAAQSSGGTDLKDPTADLERQRVKEVEAINTMDADILSLEEIENSVALGETDRDDALKSLVDALNADAGYTRWAFAPSPDATDLPPTAEQDVIRTAFIYNPSKVQLVGPSRVLSDQSGPGQPFENAREPLAQEFKRKGALDADGFLVIVNHFKSKGSGEDDGSGQGNANPDRVRQAHALVDFAEATAQADDTAKIFLVGDFNSYTQEDPMQVLYQNGFVNQPSDDPRDTSYEFGGMAGSLDHVLANTAAAHMVTGRDVWQINAEESVGFEYSRYNYNATLLYQPNQFRASDHNPELVGLSAPFSQQGSTVTATATPDRVQKKKKGTSRIDITVTGAQGVTPTGKVVVRVDGVRVGTAMLVDGHASLVVGPFDQAGDHVVKVRYQGDDVTEAGRATTTVTATNGKP